MTVALTALLSAALAGLDGTAVETLASARVETSAHALVRAGAGAPQTLAATDVLPDLALRLDHREVRLELRYDPQLRLTRELASGASAAALAHGGGARLEWDLAPTWRATGTARGAVRLVDLGTATDAPRLLDLRAGTANVRFLDTGASLGLEGRPAPLLTVGGSAAIVSSGGVDAPDRVAIPRLRELRLAGSVARAQTRRDDLRLELALVSATFDAGSGASLLTAGAGWTRGFTRALRVRLAASASQARVEGEPARVVPGAEAALDATPSVLGRPLHATLALRDGPVVDRFGAGLPERLGVDGAVRWELTPRLAVGALAAAGRLREPLGYSAVRGDLRVAWRLSPRATLSGGAWNEWHRDPRLGVAPVSSFWGASVAVELAALRR